MKNPFRKLKGLKFAPTRNPYELLRRFLPIIGADAVRKQMYAGIGKEAINAKKKGQLDKMRLQLKSDVNFSALLKDLDMSIEEVMAIIDNAIKG